MPFTNAILVFLSDVLGLGLGVGVGCVFVPIHDSRVLCYLNLVLQHRHGDAVSKLC
jgi:hypothetical protein